jgi:hypothetical protein
MDQATATAGRSLASRVLPVALIALLAGSNGIFFLQDVNARAALADARRDADAAHGATETAVSAERSRLDDARRALEDAKRELAVAEERVRSATSSGATDVHKLVADRDEARKKAAALGERVASLEGERDDAKTKAAALADRLGEVEADRDKLKRHADELDELMKLLAAKKLNARRLAGIEGPPREEAEVVSLDERRTPPVLVLRADTLEGIEEGDKLFVVRTVDGKKHEAGHAVVDKVDRTRGLLSATIARLAAGEKIGVGEKLLTYAP